MPGGATYFVVTLRGDIGPLSRQDLVEKLRAGEIAGSDRARTAFGRPLGTVAEVLGGEARRPPSDPARTSARRAAPRQHHAAPAPRTGMPIVVVVVAVVVILGLIAWALAARQSPPPAPPPGPPARQEPVAPPVQPVPPPVAAPSVQRGLLLEIFRLNFEPRDFPSIAASAKPDWSGVVDRVHDDLCTKAGFRERFYARWTGQLDILKAGEYEFILTSDDGSRLTLDGRVLIDNGGSHGMETRTGRCTLSAGLHPVRIDFFQGGGGLGLRLEWQLAGFERTELPSTVMAH